MVSTDLTGYSSSIEVGLKGRVGRQTVTPGTRSIENVLASLDQCSFTALQTVEPGRNMV